MRIGALHHDRGAGCEFRDRRNRHHKHQRWQHRPCRRVQSDGKIVVAGYSNTAFFNSIHDAVVARFTAAGALDSSFGTGGIVTTDFGGSDVANDLVLQNDGKIVVGGYTAGSSTNFALARYTTSGALDSTFGTGGKVISPIGGGSSPAYGLALQRDGKIMLAGGTYNGTYSFATARYTTSGALDTGFGSGGQVITPLSSSGTTFGYTAAIQNDGRIIVAGQTDTAIAVARYDGDITPNTLQRFIPAPSTGPQVTSGLGYSVDIDGPYAVSGAPLDDVGGQDGGGVKVFDSTTGTLLYTLASPRLADNEYFGTSVAISGSRLVVGAVQSSNYQGSTSIGGISYVYDLSSATPTVPIVTLPNPTPGSDEYFGGAVAISGSKVVVGAYMDGTDANTAGIAYVYDLNSATPAVPALTLHNPGSFKFATYFGYSVAISGDRVVVGAALGVSDIPSGNSGIAYVFDLSSATPGSPSFTLPNPYPGNQDYFGSSVAVSGNSVIVGARQDDTVGTDTGSAYVYDLGSATPALPTFTLNNPAPSHQHFGTSVSIQGTRAVVDSYVYDLSSPTPATPVTTLPLASPSSLSGSLLLAGNGIYNLDSATPTVALATLTATNPVSGDQFGSSVALSGTRLAVGAWRNDAFLKTFGNAYVYDLTSATPTVPAVSINNPTPALGDSFGQAIALSGNLLIVGAPNDDAGATDTGVAYVYDLASATPSTPVLTLNNPFPAANATFGGWVAIEGGRAAVGAASKFHVYDLTSTTPTVPIATYGAGGPVAISGARVALLSGGSLNIYDFTSSIPSTPAVTISAAGSVMSMSGSRVVVGSSGTGPAGKAWVYDLASGTPSTPIATIDNPSGSSDQFASTVAISGSRVAIGARFGYAGTVRTGLAYVFDVSSTTPTIPSATLAGTVVYDSFGFSVAIDGPTVAVGAALNDTTALDKGAVCLFGPANLDYDADGLLDLWEYAHYGGITAHTGSDDADHDGRSELLEQAFNSDPLLPDPVATMPAVVNEGGFLTLTLTKRAGLNYTVETASTPDDASFSMASTTMITNTPTTLKVRDNFTPATATQRFMRVKVTPAP